MKNIEFDFKQLIGTKAELVLRNELHQFQLGSVIFEVRENEEDGYRSSMQDILIIDSDAERNNVVCLGEVIIQEASSIDKGFQIIDCETGHKWLEFGTDNVEDFYPFFVFNWTPKEENTITNENTVDIEEIKAKIK